MSEEWSIGTLKEFFERILDERDKRYNQMFQSSQTAVSAALAAQEKAVTSAFDASEKAIVKAETAQTAYNARSNEFRASLDDQAKMLLPRTEADTRFNQLRDLIDQQAKQIVELQKSESRVVGGTSAAGAAKAQSQWTTGQAIGIIVVLIGWAMSVLFFMLTRK